MTKNIMAKVEYVKQTMMGSQAATSIQMLNLTD